MPGDLAARLAANGKVLHNSTAMHKKRVVPTIRFLGNKRRLLPEIAEAVSCVLKPGQTFIDLFAGSCCVGHYMLPDFRIYSNDVEDFSHCIAKALIEDCHHTVTSEEALKILEPYYARNMSAMSDLFRDYLQLEQYFMCRPTLFLEYSRFCADTPYIGNYQDITCPDCIMELYEQVESRRVSFPYCIFSVYFPNAYFGIRQCLQIDSIRYAIDEVAGPYANPKNSGLFYKFITALIYALSHCVSSPGHFAQFNRPNNTRICQGLLQERAKDIWECFLTYIDKLFREPVHNDFQNLAFHSDARILLSELASQLHGDSLVYIDPPYTAEQYSRFYHVLNTLPLYDYPECEGKGRYRAQRYTSAFSLRSQAASEMNILLSLARDIPVPVILSYIDEGIIELQALEELCKSHFTKVHTYEIDYNHSNQGRASASCSRRKLRRKEMLYVCYV